MNSIAAEESNHDTSEQTENIDTDIYDDFVDPRVQVELEKLNNATDAINKLEVELDEARSAFRQLLNESAHRINLLAKKLGNCVDKARPYYEARMKAKEAHAETQRAALRFERANSAHCAAKEMVYLAEEGLNKEGRIFDPAWQEMLNHATMRVNESERERTLSEQEHRLTSFSYNEAEQRVQVLQKELKRSIAKSSLTTRRSLLQLNNYAYQHQLILLPYFEMKAQFNQKMEEQKQQVRRLEEHIFKVKQSYADALHSLEEISNEIHQQRQQRQKKRMTSSRSIGTGTENPPLTQEKVASMKNSKLTLKNDDIYLSLPQKIGMSVSPFTENAVRKLYQMPEEVKSLMSIKKPINSCSGTAEGSDSKVAIVKKSPEEVNYNDRITAWIQESGLRALVAARKKSLGSSSEISPNNGIPLSSVLLNVAEESDMSDAESLNSTDVLNDDQIASLMLDKDLEDAYRDIVINSRTYQAEVQSDKDNQKELKIDQSNTFSLPNSNKCSADDELAQTCAKSIDKISIKNNVCSTEEWNPKGQEDCLPVETKAAVNKKDEISCLDQHKLKEKDGSLAENKHPEILHPIDTKASIEDEKPADSSLMTKTTEGGINEAMQQEKSFVQKEPVKEFKVVAVQFTVKETVVTPKLARAVDRRLSKNL